MSEKLMIEYKEIPNSESDLLLNEWGYNLIEEYFRMIISADFPGDSLVLEVATGTGRAASVLSRLGFKIISGDYNFQKRPEFEKRITPDFMNKVEFIMLNLERIPLSDNSINNIVCLNTLHELDKPLLSLNEIVRIHSGRGKLLIADFNSVGFDVMDKLHKDRNGVLHPRGKIKSREIETVLSQKYFELYEVNTSLNRGFITKGKK